MARDRSRSLYYVGSIVFAVLAIVLVVAFVQKWRKRNDWSDDV